MNTQEDTNYINNSTESEPLSVQFHDDRNNTTMPILSLQCPATPTFSDILSLQCPATPTFLDTLSPMHESPMHESPLPPIPSLTRCSTNDYHNSSKKEKVTSQTIYNNNKFKAETLMKTESISFNEAMSRVDENYYENEWLRRDLQPEDLKPGDILWSNIVPSVCTNSILLDGIFYDTVGITKTAGVTYRQKNNDYANHSGDIDTPYGGRGLRHIVQFNNNIPEFFVISTPWKNGHSMPIKILAKTRPVFEVRSCLNGEHMRHVIGMDFISGGDNTACVNVRVTKIDENLWKIEIMEFFLPIGHADNLQRLIEGVERIPTAIEYSVMSTADLESGSIEVVNTNDIEEIRSHDIIFSDENNLDSIPFENMIDLELGNIEVTVPHDNNLSNAITYDSNDLEYEDTNNINIVNMNDIQVNEWYGLDLVNTDDIEVNDLNVTSTTNISITYDK